MLSRDHYPGARPGGRNISEYVRGRLIRDYAATPEYDRPVDKREHRLAVRCEQQHFA